MKAAPDASVSPGQMIRKARQRTGLSQERLARDADVSTSMVIRLERADQLPNVLALGRIARRLGIPVDDLLPAEPRVETAAATP